LRKKRTLKKYSGWANHKGLIPLKQVKNTMKIDRTFFLFQGILLYHFSNTQYTPLWVFWF